MTMRFRLIVACLFFVSSPQFASENVCQTIFPAETLIKVRHEVDIVSSELLTLIAMRMPQIAAETNELLGMVGGFGYQLELRKDVRGNFVDFNKKKIVILLPGRYKLLSNLSDAELLRVTVTIAHEAKHIELAASRRFRASENMTEQEFIDQNIKILADEEARATIAGYEWGIAASHALRMKGLFAGDTVFEFYSAQKLTMGADNQSIFEHLSEHLRGVYPEGASRRKDGSSFSYLEIWTRQLKTYFKNFRLQKIQ